MKENKSENGRMVDRKDGGLKEKRNGKKDFSRLFPLVNLLPAALVILLIAGTLPVTGPMLREIPELLTIDAKASESLAETEEEAEAEKEVEQEKEKEPLVKTEFEEPEGYVDGIYYGSARGFGGTIQVKVVISGGKIADISIVSASGETPSYLSSAKKVISRMLSAQSPNVDTVSGATYSSNGIINAVKTALRKAAGSGVSDDLTVDDNAADLSENSAADPAGSLKKPVIEKTEAPADGYVDGVYTGTAEGFGGDITVQVTISGGKIVSVDILSAEDETPSYLEQAEAVTGRIVAAQSTDVDVVSGATYSSTGILNAAAEALRKAKPAESADEGSAGQTDSQDTENPGEENYDGNNPGSDNTETAGTEDTEYSDSESSAAEETPAKYKDGVYQASALCSDEDTFIYTVQVNATVTNGKIEEIQVEKLNDISDFPEDNDVYLDYAINGRTRKNVWYEGVVKQILTAQSTDQIDAVSSATYSSNAIIAAAQEALEPALIENEEVETETAEMPEGTESTEAAETPEGTESSEEEETPEETESAEEEEIHEIAEDCETVENSGEAGSAKNSRGNYILSFLLDFFDKVRFYA